MKKTAAASAAPSAAAVFLVQDYHLDFTLDSGQAFRWRRHGEAWEGAVGGRWVRLQAGPQRLEASTAAPVPGWDWLADYLQVEARLGAILESFPADDLMRRAIEACRGLRLLRQDPWECLASFLLSSTKQIVQIRQMVELLCRRYGDPLAVPPGTEPMNAFPTAARLAACSEKELRECKLGFRAPYLRETARWVAENGEAFGHLAGLPLAQAREQLVQLPGVGEKIAECVLLFAFGMSSAFPIDVWIARGLGRHYFPGRRVSARRLREFAAGYFGPHAGYAQQYLFHYLRTQS